MLKKILYEYTVLLTKISIYWKILLVNYYFFMFMYFIKYFALYTWSISIGIACIQLICIVKKNYSVFLIRRDWWIFEFLRNACIIFENQIESHQKAVGPIISYHSKSCLSQGLSYTPHVQFNPFTYLKCLKMNRIHEKIVEFYVYQNWMEAHYARLINRKTC